MIHAYFGISGRSLRIEKISFISFWVSGDIIPKKIGMKSHLGKELHTSSGFLMEFAWKFTININRGICKGPLHYLTPWSTGPPSCPITPYLDPPNNHLHLVKNWSGVMAGNSHDILIIWTAKFCKPFHHISPCQLLLLQLIHPHPKKTHAPTLNSLCFRGIVQGIVQVMVDALNHFLRWLPSGL